MNGKGFINLNSGNDYIEAVLRKVKETLSLSDDDIDILRRSNKLLLQPTPTAQVMVEQRVDSLDHMGVELRNLLYILEEQFGVYKYEYMSIYDERFTNLTRKGRPSQQAIDSEIHAGDEFMQNRRILLASFENIRNLILGYLKSIRDSKETLMKKWGFV